MQIKTLLFVIFFTFKAFGFEVKVVATIGNEVITSYEVKQRIELMNIINPEFTKQTDEVKQGAVLDSLIKEKLLFKTAKDNNFEISQKEIETSISDISKTNPAIIKIKKDSNLYETLTLQIKGEIIFSVFLQNEIKGKLEFSDDEITRFKNSYNQEHQIKIDDKKSKQILTSMKMQEIQSEFLKNLQERVIIEKK